MAYCKSCGAYIPDGQDVCLACGYDEHAQQRSSAASAKAAEPKKTNDSGGKEKYRQFDSDFLRRQLDEQRRRQQENNRKWAETEYAQRRKTKEEQARNFTNTSARPGSEAYRTVRSAMNSDETGKVMAGLSYFPFLFLLPYFFRKDDQFATYHAQQGFKLFLARMIANVVGAFTGLGWLVLPATLYMMYKGISNVVKGKKNPLPIIGNLFK